MKKTKTKTLKIVKLERRKNSIYGNPSWAISAIDDEGNYYSGKTASNAMIGYELSWMDEGENMQLAFHYTKNGTIEELVEKMVEVVTA